VSDLRIGKAHSSFTEAGLVVGDGTQNRVPVCPFITSLRIFPVLITDFNPRVLPLTSIVQLRATIMNTIYRQPKRIPFHYLDLLTSSAVTAIRTGPTPEWLAHAFARRMLEAGTLDATSVPFEEQQARNARFTKRRPERTPAWPVSIDLGTWDVDELQICDIKHHGPEGDYIPVHHISLVQ
jgi:hypothetical protein